MPASAVFLKWLADVGLLDDKDEYLEKMGFPTCGPPHGGFPHMGPYGNIGPARSDFVTLPSRKDILGIAERTAR